MKSVWIYTFVCVVTVDDCYLASVLQTLMFLPPDSWSPIGTIASLLFTVLPL